MVRRLRRHSITLARRAARELRKLIQGNVEGWVGFPVAEVEVPPLEWVGEEAVFLHHRFEEFGIAGSFGGDAGGVAVGTLGEIVEGGGHGEFLAVLIDEG